MGPGIARRAPGGERALGIVDLGKALAEWILQRKWQSTMNHQQSAFSNSRQSTMINRQSAISNSRPGLRGIDDLGLMILDC
jgi:hypothetical protein